MKDSKSEKATNSLIGKSIKITDRLCHEGLIIGGKYTIVDVQHPDTKNGTLTLAGVSQIWHVDLRSPYQHFTFVIETKYPDISKDLIGKSIRILSVNGSQRLVKGEVYKVLNVDRYNLHLSVHSRALIWSAVSNSIKKHFEVVEDQKEVTTIQTGLDRNKLDSNKVYHYEANQQCYLAKGAAKGEKGALSITNSTFRCNSLAQNHTDWQWIIREATNEEVYWYEACEKAKCFLNVPIKSSTITSSLKRKELSKDTVYVYSKDAYKYITTGSAEGVKGIHIASSGNPQFVDCNLRDDWNWTIKEADDDEKNWLIACKHANSIVPFKAKEDLKHEFKVGDWVITKRFTSIPDCTFVDEMKGSVGKKGKITSIRRGAVAAVGCWEWPFSALDFVSSKADEVIVSELYTKVIETTQEPKVTSFIKGDYIVFLRPASEDTAWLKYGYVYVIAGNTDYFDTNKDCRGEGCSAANVVFRDNSNWRYATEEEIAEYDKLGKPYNAIHKSKPQPISKPQFEVGQWVIFVAEGHYSASPENESLSSLAKRAKSKRFLTSAKESIGVIKYCNNNDIWWYRLVGDAIWYEEKCFASCEKSSTSDTKILEGLWEALEYDCDAKTIASTKAESGTDIGVAHQQPIIYKGPSKKKVKLVIVI